MILLVDRDPDTRIILRSVLEWSDFEVLEARDAGTARRMMQARALRLVITEHPLPVEGDRTLLHALRDDPGTADLPVLVVTSTAAPEIAAQALSLGCDRVLVKPFSPARALEEVRRLLEASGSPGAGALMLMIPGSAGGAQSPSGSASAPRPQDPDPMTTADKDRDLRSERMERESFIALQHLYTVSEGNSSRWMPCARMRADLGLTQEETAQIVEHLCAVELIASDGDSIAIRPDGVGYIERLAWRRHTVRKQGGRA